MGSPHNLPTPPPLDALVRDGPVAMFLDFDGTLVEIAPTHDTIRVPHILPAALERLSRKLDGRLALVSGRSLENLATHLGNLAIAQAGSHGADCRLASGERVGSTPRAMSPSVIAALEELVRRYEGATLETKNHGVAVHYRARPVIEPQVVEAAEDIAASHDLSVKRGKCVIELLSDNADKGEAVRAFMSERAFASARPIFIGDDVTDEDGFAAVKEFAGLGVLVGGSRVTKACYRLDGPKDVYSWLGLEIS